MLGTNNDWPRGAVRALGHRHGDAAGETHRHERDDASPGWLDWPDHPNLLLAIDQWCCIDRYGSMHLSSLSVLVQALEAVVENPVVPSR